MIKISRAKGSSQYRKPSGSPSQSKASVWLAQDRVSNEWRMAWF